MATPKQTGVIVMAVLGTLGLVAILAVGPVALKVGIGVLVLFGTYFVWSANRS